MKQLRVFSILVLLSLLFFALPATGAAAETPGETIVRIIDQGMKILRDPDLQAPEKMPERRARLWELLEPVFDFEEVGKRALGRYWLNLNPAQRERFSNGFTLMLKRMYLNKSDLYKEGEVEYIREIVQGKRGKVQTNFVKADGNKIEVILSMYNADGDGWKVYDVQIGGVSVLSNYRSQFNSILAKESFEELMEKIDEKVNEPEEE